MGLEEAMRLEIEELIEEKTALRAQLMGKTTAEAIKMAFDNGDSYLESVMVRAKRAEAERDTLRAQLATANERAEKAEALAAEAQIRAIEHRETAENYAGHCNAACAQIDALEAERDALAARVAAKGEKR